MVDHHVHSYHGISRYPIFSQTQELGHFTQIGSKLAPQRGMDSEGLHATKSPGQNERRAKFRTWVLSQTTIEPKIPIRPKKFSWGTCKHAFRGRHILLAHKCARNVVSRIKPSISGGQKARSGLGPSSFENGSPNRLQMM